jgi:hypothetical protein
LAENHLESKSLLSQREPMSENPLPSLRQSRPRVQIAREALEQDADAGANIGVGALF